MHMHMYTHVHTHAERVLILEADLRRCEETIQSLQQELALTKLAQTPTTDTGRYQLGRESGHGMPVVPQQRSMEEVATIVSETAIAKGIYMCAHVCIHTLYTYILHTVQCTCTCMYNASQAIWFMKGLFGSCTYLVYK